MYGEGELNARLMLVALSPGQNEDREGKMFIGPSGKILDELLQSAGIERNSLYMTNLIKCVLPKNRKPKQDEIEACSPVLDEEINMLLPDIIVPLGYYATRYILTKYAADPPLAHTDFQAVYGKLIYSNDQKTFPLPHPASLIYNPSYKQETMKKYHKLEILFRDCKWATMCPMKWYFEKGRLQRKWIELYCKGDWESCIRYQKEASGTYHQDWMLPDGSLDESLI
ncbi:uracil DNA glycosylase superfamily protein [bacterium BMS3Bbin03]|nr:uracil DNA glycosylase superfamily protein [bacterium BMS3Bbin03]